jgi:phosphatidylserine/phosphatidylglycerophosphate/cardiolipin synthase-like enzyme
MNTDASAPVDNREYLALDTDAADVAEAEAIFEADDANQPTAPSGALIVSPVNSRASLLAFIAGATTSIAVEVEELSDPQVTNALCAAAARGVKTSVIIASESSGLSAAQQEAAGALDDCAVPVVTLVTPYIHAKAIVVDESRIYVGSINLSQVSLDQNRELGLFTANAAALEAVATTVAGDMAAGTPVVEQGR